MKFIIDVDGTLLNGRKANLDALEFIKSLEKANYPYVLMTNSVKSPNLIAERLADVGIRVKPDRIFNPIASMNTYVESMGYQQAFVVASESEKQQLSIDVVDENPDVVLLVDFEKENYAYQDLQKLVELAEVGIPFVTASRSTHYLRNKKRHIDTGSFVNLIENITGIDILVTGKPSKAYFEAGLKVLQADASEVTVVGDDWRTDMKGGLSVGCKVILLQSGKYQKGDEEELEGVGCVKQLMDILLV